MYSTFLGIVAAFLSALPSGLAQDTLNPTGDVEFVNGSPVLSIFLPMGAPDRIAASIIFAEANRTAFEIKCLDPEPSTTTTTSASLPKHTTSTPASPCSLATPITITEGISTLEYTMTFTHEPMPASIPSFFPNTETTKTEEATINCQLVGGTRASQAFCTSRTEISGLGHAQATVTLAREQISYASVRITAGVEKASNLARIASDGAVAGGGGGDQRSSGEGGGTTKSRGMAVALSQPTGLAGRFGILGGALGVGLVLF